MNHKKTDRMLGLAERGACRWCSSPRAAAAGPAIPTGSASPASTCRPSCSSPSCRGLVPLVGVVSGRCFAGNAALLGCCDVIIATRKPIIGMGGPAMIEGGGLGVYQPDEIGPVERAGANGVIDIWSRTRPRRSRARKHTVLFPGAGSDWTAPDQRLLRRAIPENRLRVYDIRDRHRGAGGHRLGAGDAARLRRRHGHRADPHRGPADRPDRQQPEGAGRGDRRATAADKAARFMQLCDAFDLPILSLCDTPGLHGRAGGREDRAGAPRLRGCSSSAPTSTVPLLSRRAAQGLRPGRPGDDRRRLPRAGFTVAWPTGEFGGMGLEGSVRLGYRKELEAIADPAERRKVRQDGRRGLRDGKALNRATSFGIDDVIDPADTRRWIMGALRRRRRRPERTARSSAGSTPGRAAREEKRRTGGQRGRPSECRRRAGADQLARLGADAAEAMRPAALSRNGSDLRQKRCWRNSRKKCSMV